MNHPGIELMVDTFLDHIRYLKIIHHVTGRIRVKATWNGAMQLADLPDGEIDRVIAALPGVIDYRLNKKALSLIINYDPGVLPFTLWEEVGSLAERPQHRDRVRQQLLAIINQL